MQRDEQRMRAVQGLRWLEGEVRELVDMAKFRSASDQKLFKIQFERVRERISEFEKDLIDLLICYPETRDTLPLRRLLEGRAALPERAELRLARLRAQLAELNSVLKAAPADQLAAIRARIADKEREIRAAEG
jgi:hypothetical protein